MTNSTANSLFKGAVQDGVLSKAALQAIDVDDIGANINAALGVSVDDVTASEVTLVSLLIDDSSSIRFVNGNTQAVRDGHNLVLDALAKTKQKDGILAMCSYLNRGLLYPYASVDQAVRMSANNYDPSGGTPLYSKTVELLGTVVAKSQDFLHNGIACKTVTAIITDGNDESMRGKTASDVRMIVEDMLRAENHIIAGVGIDDGGTDFKRVFGEMGIRDEWILTPKNSPSEIRKAFSMLSQSAQRASQASGATFSQAAMGGFATP
jgi:hypothetical protein